MSAAEGFVAVIGGGLAGCECSWQLARAGVRVRLYEMRPQQRSAAHRSGQLGELVCSNSFRAASVENAVGLIKEELRRMGSLVMRVADATRVPAGGAHAVNREAFAAGITEAIEALPEIELLRQEVRGLDDPVLRGATAIVVASGPLTSGGLAESIVSRTGAERLWFYDAIAPVVEADSIDRTKVFAASRYGKGGDDYLNCPLDEAGYHAFVDALVEAETATAHAPDAELRFFPGCQPIEEIARQGRMAPAFGPMKPVGLLDPRTGRRPFAVVQLRAENLERTAYNLVGFQTRLKHGEQLRILRALPGLEGATFLRLGSAHRNTYLDSPRLLDRRLRLRDEPRIRFAGQISGVEGYVESTACGLLQGVFSTAEALGRSVEPPPATTALGALLGHLGNDLHPDFQPSNIHWGHFPPLRGGAGLREPLEGRRIPGGRRGRRIRRGLMAERALEALDGWLESMSSAPASPAEP